MSKYVITFTQTGESWDLGTFANDTDAAIHAELVLCIRDYDIFKIVCSEWEQGRLLIWANETDAANNAEATAICSIERR